VLFALPGTRHLASALARRVGLARGAPPIRPFPDGETHVRVTTPVRGRDVVLLGALDRPDARTLPLLLVAATLRDLGARRVGLVAPYLAYMRQDTRFASGEGITSVYFARLVSRAVDWLVTIDPHLHRHHSLAAVYSIPATALSAASSLGAWIGRHVERPLLVGPDGESAQWVEAVAAPRRLPYVVLDKVRRTDRTVEVSVPDVARWRGHTPVVIDDIISTAATMVATVRHLRRARLAPPLCVAVHAVFADGAYDDLRRAGAARVVTCNTIEHATNAIDIAPVLADGVLAGLRRARGRVRPAPRRVRSTARSVRDR